MVEFYNFDIVVINGTSNVNHAEASSAQSIFIGSSRIIIGSVSIEITPNNDYTISKYSLTSGVFKAQLFPLITYSVSSLPETSLSTLYIYCIPSDYKELIGLYSPF